MRITYVVHKSEQNSLRAQTCAATLGSLRPQTFRCAATFSSLNKALVQFQQKLILKVYIANEIKTLIKMNLRKHCCIRNVNFY